MKIEDNKSLSKWLEECLKFVYDHNSESMCILATTKEGNIFSSYYHCGIPDKILYAGYIQQDAMMDSFEREHMMICADYMEQIPEDEYPEEYDENADEEFQAFLEEFLNSEYE